MTIMRIHKKQNNFVILDTTFLKDINLTAKAKGILAYLLSLPHDWRVNVMELTTHFVDGKSAIYSGIQELKQYGYVVYEKKRSLNGSFTAGEYIVYETPQTQEDTEPDSFSPDTDNPDPENRDMGFRDTEKPNLENQKQLNMNNNKYKKNKIAAEANTIANNSKPEVQKENLPAAVFDKTIKSEKIADTLSPSQEQAVFVFVDELIAAMPTLSKDSVLAQIKENLLSPQHFSKAHDDFYKKFNTIKKSIREGRFIFSNKSSPTGNENPQHSNGLTPKEKSLLKKYHEKEHEVWMHIASLNKHGTLNEDFALQCQKQIEQSMGQLEQLEHVLLSKNIPFQRRFIPQDNTKKETNLC